MLLLVGLWDTVGSRVLQQLEVLRLLDAVGVAPDCPAPAFMSCAVGQHFFFLQRQPTIIGTVFPCMGVWLVEGNLAHADMYYRDKVDSIASQERDREREREKGGGKYIYWVWIDMGR